MGRVRRAVKSLALCVKPHSKADVSLIGREGYNRQVRCNNAAWNAQKFGYRNNAISTTKYNMFTFVPKALFEQFRRLANVFFLAQAALSLFPSVTPFQPMTLIGPLVLVVGVSIVKEWLEDFRRFQLDLKVNARKVKVHVGAGVFETRRWRDLRVGDVIIVDKNAFFPADLLMLSSSNNEAMCYVETMNLDGETNLKPKKAIQETTHLNVPEVFRDWQAFIQCEEPNPSLYTFVGNLDLSSGVEGIGVGVGGLGLGVGVGGGIVPGGGGGGGGRVFSVGPSNLLLRDSKLRNTAWVYGVVIFTGHDTKVMQNATEPPSKRSRLEKQMDYVIIVLFCTLLVISIISGLVYGVWLDTTVPRFWYLAPEVKETPTFNTKKPVLSGLGLFVTSLILYGYLIPISLYVSIEVVKMVQAMFINQDIKMHHEDTNTWAHARTSNLNEELGQVDTVLSDKTGTLTCNVMEFLKCSIAGVSYGRGLTEVERATAKRLGKLLKEEEEGEEEDERVGGEERESSMLQKQERPLIEVFGDTESEISGGLGGVIGRTGKMEPSRVSESVSGDWLTTSSMVMSAAETDDDDASRSRLRGGNGGRKKKRFAGWAVARKHSRTSSTSACPSSASSSSSRPFRKKPGSTEQWKKDKHHVKGFNFRDGRLMRGNWIKQSNREQIRMFFRVLSVCHTVVPEVDDSSGELKYEAESPDEAAFVIAAQQFGFVFVKRTPSGVHVIEPPEAGGGRETSPAQPHQRVYNVLAVLEFNSTRKRMSVIVRDPENQIILMCKGADSVIYERLSAAGKKYAEATAEHMKQYGEAGLRTLALSYRVLSEEEYSNWNEVFQEAKTTMGPERDAKIDEAAEAIEQELVLVGATGVEDKLQPGVPETIDRLAQAGLKIWVLTGDKVETAINIGYAASLLRTGMTQIVVSLDSPEVKAAEELGNKQKLFQIAIASVTSQIADGLDLIRHEGRNGNKNGEDPVYALVIDGRALAFALDDSLKDKFLELAMGCASVICCRVSPKQKALVTMLVKEGTGNVTLGIGDGANDVGMIQAADIGVGISGVEGMQAVMASDFSIGQFRFLERLLIVHGHWCYKRIALMVSYFFYKNLAFGLTVFYFNSNALFSGQSIYEEWAMALYNVIFTSVPVIVVGIFEQDVSADTCLKFPALYRQGPGNAFFSWGRIFLWMAHGVYNSIVLFFLVVIAFSFGAFRSDGKVADMWAVGTSMYTCIIWTVTVQLALSISYFTWVHHLALWGSVACWYVYLAIYGLLSLDLNPLKGVLSDELAPSPTFWLLTILLPIISVFPSFLYTACLRQFRPCDHHIIGEIVKLELQKKDPAMWRREQRKARHRPKFGFTSAVDEAVRRMRSKAHRGLSTSV